MPLPVFASPPSPPAHAARVSHRCRNSLRMMVSSALLTLFASACAQSQGPLVLVDSAPAAATSSTTITNKKPMVTIPKNAPPDVPHMSAGEISKRMLNLIDKIRTAEDISVKNLEIATGLKVYLDAGNPLRYGTGAKISDTWFFNISVIAGNQQGKRSRLIFSFNDQTHNDADMDDICQVDFAAYSKRLTEIGFHSAPVYGEHSRISYWTFSRGEIAVHINIRGESDKKVNHNCVSIIDIEI